MGKNFQPFPIEAWGVALLWELDNFRIGLFGAVERQTKQRTGLLLKCLGRNFVFLQAVFCLSFKFCLIMMFPVYMIIIFSNKKKNLPF